MWPFGNNFPYTNYHDLNLDWVIKSVKELFTRTEKVENDVKTCNQYISTIDSEIQQKINEEVPEAIEQAIQAGLFDDVLAASRTRRVLIISDSYGAGWTPDGDVTGFPVLIKSMLHLSDANFFNVNKGGAKFGAAAGSEYAFDEVLSSSLPNITNKETITDIIFAGGYNDASASDEVIREGIQRCKSVIGLNFTNPSLKVYLFAIGYHASNMTNRYNLWKKYQECYSKSGWAYTRLTPAICYDDWWASDGYHPKAQAQNAIATQIVNIIQGGTSTSRCVNDEYATMSYGGNARFYSAMLENYFDSFLFGTAIPQSTPITLQNSSYTKICSITSKLPIANIADASIRQKYTINAIIKTGESSYTSANLIIYLTQSARNTYDVMASIFATNQAGTNYLVLSNVTEIQILSGSLHIQIPYQF